MSIESKGIAPVSIGIGPTFRGPSFGPKSPSFTPNFSPNFSRSLSVAPTRTAPNITKAVEISPKGAIKTSFEGKNIQPKNAFKGTVEVARPKGIEATKAPAKVEAPKINVLRDIPNSVKPARFLETTRPLAKSDIKMPAAERPVSRETFTRIMTREIIKASPAEGLKPQIKGSERFSGESKVKISPELRAKIAESYRVARVARSEAAGARKIIEAAGVKSVTRVETIAKPRAEEKSRVAESKPKTAVKPEINTVKAEVAKLEEQIKTGAQSEKVQKQVTALKEKVAIAEKAKEQIKDNPKKELTTVFEKTVVTEVTQAAKAYQSLKESTSPEYATETITKALEAKGVKVTEKITKEQFQQILEIEGKKFEVQVKVAEVEKTEEEDLIIERDPNAIAERQRRVREAVQKAFSEKRKEMEKAGEEGPVRVHGADIIEQLGEEQVSSNGKLKEINSGSWAFMQMAIIAGGYYGSENEAIAAGDRAIDFNPPLRMVKAKSTPEATPEEIAKELEDPKKLEVAQAVAYNLMRGKVNPNIIDLKYDPQTATYKQAA